MSRVAGVDGAPDGWAVVIREEHKWHTRKVATFSELFRDAAGFDIVAVDIPIGLCDAYETGGRVCDREARKFVRERASSVFPAPVRPVLAASSWEDACALSKGSAPHGKKISKQTFGILPKIREVDELLQTRPDLRNAVREVHPEVCFCELANSLGRSPMNFSKRRQEGSDERLQSLRQCFHDLDIIVKAGRKQRLSLVDILDATVACWSALRLAAGTGRSLVQPVPRDTTGLPMTIWV